jgi:two-component system nitrate/nitrite response regulator NarL
VPITCLIVDDSEAFLRSAARLLALQGFRVVGLAASAGEAMELAGSLRPDVALVDVELGEEDGIGLARALAGHGRAAHVVLISLRDRGELAEMLSGSGAAGFLRKDALDATAVMKLIAGNAHGESPALRPR